MIVAFPGLFSYLFYSTDRSKAVVPVLVLLFVALWFILRGNLSYVLPCVILFLCFSVLLAMRLPRLWKRELILVHFVHFVLVFFSPFSIAITSLGKKELILVLFVRLFDLHLFDFVCFFFLLVSGKGCSL